MRGEYVDEPDRRPRVGGGPPSRRCSGDPSRLGRSSRSERRLAGEERQAARCGVPRALAFAHGRRRAAVWNAPFSLGILKGPV